MKRSLIAIACSSTACTLGPSPLGDLPGASTGAGGGTTGATTADPATDGAPTTTGDAASTGVDTGGPPGTAWEAYCAHVQAHGGECDPDVDMSPDLQYPGQGFIVHEWGTDTVVVGSDGVTLRGLHHEEEDLPAFVYDRIAAGQLDGSTSVHVKMETPVTYFYSEVPRSVDVSVGFPAGVFTHWYPAVAWFEPFIAAPGAIPKLPQYSDPVLDPLFPFASDLCRTEYGAIGGGQLHWGAVGVLARDAEEALPAAPLGEFTWSHARAVDANLVEVAGVPGATTPQHERFLFYRGLGNFPLPLTLTVGDGPTLTVTNDSALAVGRLFVVHVAADRGAFAEWGDGVSGGQSVTDPAPALASAPPLDLFADALGERVTEALDATGLYHDEAAAMVETWKRQWFRTPGLRVLYLVPQSWTDASIPLTIAPPPGSTTRVMMIRAEVLTPEQEAQDVAAASLLSDPNDAAAGKQHFFDLGRFAEPRLRRAAALLGEPAPVVEFLSQIVHADTRVALGE